MSSGIFESKGFKAIRDGIKGMLEKTSFKPSYENRINEKKLIMEIVSSNVSPRASFLPSDMSNFRKSHEVFS